MTRPGIELLYWDGCPSYQRALDLLEATLDDLGRNDVVAVRHVDTEEAAWRERFIGSPTIRVGGRDLFPTGDQPYGLNCRIYRLGDGRVSPLPDTGQLRELLAKALSG